MLKFKVIGKEKKTENMPGEPCRRANPELSTPRTAYWVRGTIRHTILGGRVVPDTVCQSFARTVPGTTHILGLHKGVEEERDGDD